MLSLFLLVCLQGNEVLSLIPSQGVPVCLENPLELLPDLNDCHIFYQCDINPQPMSCGDMMFNSQTQVCDWPSRVLQLRPECRNVEQLRFHSKETKELPTYGQRTLRMLRLFGDGDPFSQKRLRAPQDVGLGRRKNFGNREFNRKKSRKDGIEYYKEKVMNRKDYEKEAHAQYDDYDVNLTGYDQYEDVVNNDVYSEERIDSIPHDKTIIEVQGPSLPADTFRLEPEPQNPGPNYVYEQYYPEQLPQDRPHLPLTQGSPQHLQQASLGVPEVQEIVQPRPAPILIEETREYKQPVWTVTRERPKQRILKKIKKVGPNDIGDGENKKALTLKEAYERAVQRMDRISEPQQFENNENLLTEILNRDFGAENNYINSDDLRSGSYGFFN